MISKHQNPFTAQAISSAGDSIVLHSEKSPQWTLPHIKSILRNEKYCGDVLMQKTFQQDVINRKVIKNTGQLPMYLIENHHEGIVSREKHNVVQASTARCTAFPPRSLHRWWSTDPLCALHSHIAVRPPTEHCRRSFFFSFRFLRFPEQRASRRLLPRF